MRAYGIEPSSDLAGNFSDAGDTYYTPYLATARRMGIVDGIGDNLYAPERAMTRQEMFVLTYNVLTKIAELPESDVRAKPLDAYLDASDIAQWAREAAKIFAESGLIVGDGDRLFPLNLSSRSQMAQVLYNILTR